MSVDFNRIVFFGDSLTDDGNLPEPVRPDPPYVGGRFTNGAVYAQVLTRELGVASDNYALGGAEASTDAGDRLPQRLINLSAQVDTILPSNPRTAGSAGSAAGSIPARPPRSSSAATTSSMSVL